MMGTPIQSYKHWVSDEKEYPALGSDEYQLCQRQVLPPPPTKESESPTRPEFNKARDLSRFVKGGRKGVFWEAQDLGAGAQGQAWVYTLLDANHVPIHRVVRKETASIEDFDDWACPYSWHGDTSSPTFRNECVPLEFHTQDLVSSARSSHAVKLLAPPQVLWEEYKYRLYMEYAPNGDLDKVIGLHDIHSEPVPETFLWLVLQALATTALIMEQGDTRRRLDEWSEVVHCDYKAGNVFLGLPNGKYYNQYPTIKLGDFGLAFPTSDQDKTNPIWWSDRGTEGHFAPEQLHYTDSVTGESLGNTQKILAPANVYGLATILFQLMERVQYIGEQPTWESTVPIPAGAVPDNPEFKFSDENRALYSDRLVDLVEKCFAFKPEDRPSCEALIAACKARLSGRASKKERDGDVDEMGDTLLLLEQDAAKLKWASRLNGEGLDEQGNRIERDADVEMEDDEDEDMEDEDDEEMEDDG